MEKNPLTKSQRIQLATEIYEWCMKNGLWLDVTIYFNDKAWSSSSKWHGEKGKKIDDDLYEYKDRDPRIYFQHVREPNILSMTFEGGLNHVLNAYTPGWVKLEDEFYKIFEKYGVYYEMGEAWNLSAYEI